MAARTADPAVSDEELDKRRADWQQPPPKFGRGYGALYLQHITQADQGCDFDFLEAGTGHPRTRDPLSTTVLSRRKTRRSTDPHPAVNDTVVPTHGRPASRRPPPMSVVRHR